MKRIKISDMFKKLFDNHEHIGSINTVKNALEILERNEITVILIEQKSA